MKNIAIIGSGSFGLALAYILSKNKNNIKIWSYTQEETDSINNNHRGLFLKDLILDKNIRCYTSYKDAIEDSEYIILVTPSDVIRDTCKQIKEHITNQEIIIASKGIEKDKLLSDIVKEELNIIPSIITGPSHAEQIIKNIPTYIEYSGNKTIKEIFETDTFKLIYNEDIIGMQVGAALKNIISLAIGIAEGLNYESNTISYIIIEGLKEIKDIGIKMGADEKTFYGLSGLGDLLTTSFSLDSRNKRAGLLLAKGETLQEVKQEIGMTIESINSLNNARYLIKKYELNCIIIDNLYKIIYENKQVDNIIK